MKTSAQEMSDAAFANHSGVKLLKSGRWAARVQHPTTKIWVLVGIYNTPQEAADSCTRKKLKYDSRSLQEIPSYIDKNLSIRRKRSSKWTPENKHKLKSVWPDTFITSNSTKNGCLRKKEGSVYQVKSGNWQAAINMRNVRHYLGTYATAQQAQEAINCKRCDLLALNPTTNKKSEFDLMVRAQKKRKQSNDRFEADDDESFVNTGDGLISVTVNEPIEEEESGKSMISEEVESLLEIGTGEFDLGIIDRYGRLVGEYSRLDDELWIC